MLLSSTNNDRRTDVQQKNRSIFYGYPVLACCFLFTLVLESAMVVFSLFIKPLQTELGWSQTFILGGSTILTAAGAAVSPFAGRLVITYGARKMICLGTILVAAGYALLSLAAAPWHFYVGCVLIGFGYTGAGMITLTYIVSNWFERRRGTAVGAMSTGVGVSSIVFAPLVAIYLLPAFGWRAAYLILGVIHVAIILPLTLLVIRSSPADVGLEAYGARDHADQNEAAGRAAQEPTPVSSVPLSMAVRSSAFWLIGISLIFNHTHLGILQTLFPHLGEAGFSSTVAASAVGACGMASTFGMFFFGWLCDRLDAPRASAIGLALIALGTALLMIVRSGSPAGLLWIAVVLLGIGVGSWMPTMSMLTSLTFGMGFYTAIFGWLSIFACAGAAAGPVIAGLIHDTTQSYLSAFGIIGIMIVLAIPAVLVVRPPQALAARPPSK